jgi:subtilase family serine protease
MRTYLKCTRLSRRRIIGLSPAIALSLALTTAAQAQWVSTATQVPYLKNAVLLGSVPSTMPMHIVVGLQIRNADQVQPTLRRMLTPNDPLYGTSYTVEQYVQEFAPTSAQVQAVENYLSKFGFTNLTVEDNRLLIQADGTAGMVAAAFNTSLSNFSLNGKTIYANTSDAQVPKQLSGTVLAVLGLNNITSFHSDIHTLTTKQQALKAEKNLEAPPPTDPCSPVPAGCPLPDVSNEVYGPWQYQIAYDAAYPGANPNSTNLKQKLTPGCSTPIGIIVEGHIGTVSPKYPNGPGIPSASSTGVIHDLYLYESNYKLPGVPVNIVYAGIPSNDTAGVDEWDLDSQTSTGIAEQVSALYFYVATSLTDSDIGLAINKAVEQNKVKAFNMSFGECELFPYNDGAMFVDDEMFGEAALQGMTPFASSDDQGSACPAVGTNGIPLSGPPDTSYPASSPYVIAVGGTNLTTNTNYTFDWEAPWEASGGGPSYFETPPFWQSYTGSGTVAIVPSAEVNAAVGCPMGCRGVPDVAMCAGGTGLAICSANIYVNGATELVGGTSLSSPLSVGSWARIESAHGNKLGFAGPLIYQLADGAPVLDSPWFNDVDFLPPIGNGLFVNEPGWDYVTGLGSWDILVVNQKIPSSYPH